MSRWVVTGGYGMLGTDLRAVAEQAGHEVVGLDRADCDIVDLAGLRRHLRGADVVVNTAAFTAVDAAEDNESQAFSVNAVGARNVALAGREAAATVVTISTDYVFDGQASSPYRENELQAPRSAYGRTKAAGEWAVRTVNPDALIVRTAWLYGEHGPNFVATMLRLTGERETLTVVDDQIGQPTWTGDLSRYLVQLVDSGAAGGYYHGTSEGQVSWCGFAREIFRLAGLDPARVQAISTADFPRSAPRPAYSVLAHTAGEPRLPDWQTSLRASGLVGSP